LSSKWTQVSSVKLLEALNRLEREDPQWQRQFDDLYGEGLRAMQRGDLVKVDLDSFGPDD
jgi:hypothetical protein